jgi:hypothetical protein
VTTRQSLMALVLSEFTSAFGGIARMDAARNSPSATMFQRPHGVTSAEFIGIFLKRLAVEAQCIAVVPSSCWMLLK